MLPPLQMATNSTGGGGLSEESVESRDKVLDIAQDKGSVRGDV